jgi:hypothetical protein
MKIRSILMDFSEETLKLFSNFPQNAQEIEMDISRKFGDLFFSE